MPSSKRTIAGALAVFASWSVPANAQDPVPGFAVERLYPSAPGAGWIVADELRMHGGFGGALALTGGYAHAPLTVSSGAQSLTVVGDQAFAEVALAVSYQRYRASVAFTSPLLGDGDSGAVGAYTFAAPTVDVGRRPDLMSDLRLGVDARLVGDERSPFRAGVGLQLFVPNGSRADYVTDGSYRAMARALFAGDAGAFTFAGHLGAHLRPLDDGPVPGSPRGAELLFAVAAGGTTPIGDAARLVVGPEIFGASAFAALFARDETALEALLSARIEGTRDGSAQLRVKLGAGGGLIPQFGAPEWRAVVGVEMFIHNAERR